MANYGIKVVQSGKSISSTDVRDITLSSQYTMLKYHSDNTASLTVSSGNTSGSVSVSHSLGYVPIFIAYVRYTWFDSYQRILPQGRIPQQHAINGFSTSSNVTCKVVKISEGVDRTYDFRVIIFKDRIV